MARQKERNRTTNLVRLTVDVQLGTASPSRKQAWKRFWQKIISDVKADERERRQKQ